MTDGKFIGHAHATMNLDCALPDEPCCFASLDFGRSTGRGLIRRLIVTHDVVITIEEGSIGGLGAHVLTMASDEGLTDSGLKIRTMRLPDVFQDHEAPDKQYDTAGLTAPHIVETVLKALRHNSAGVQEARA